MKKAKIFIALTLCLTLLTSNICYASNSNEYSAITLNTNQSERASWTATIKALKWILVKADGKLFYRKPNSSSTSSSVTTSSGTVVYGKDAQRTKFVFNIDSKKKLDLWAQTNFSNWTGKITIFVENSSGKQVAGKTVTHNQHIFTTVPAGKYSCYYVGPNKQKWDSWLNIANTSKNISESSVVIDYTNNKSYTIPSSTHTAALSLVNHNTLDASELDSEFYDEILGTYVNMSKHFDIGDDIIFEDTIDKIEYIAEENKTVFKFAMKNGDELSFPFSNDLTKNFAIGDKIKLNFKISEEFKNENITFQNLDYILEVQKGLDNNIYPNIQDYLL